VDLVVEAVFEDPDLKVAVFREIADVVNADAVLASNTSTLPITGLASGVDRPEDFVGLHFFSPVDKMPLVEIIRGAKTSDETLARAFDYVLQINKIPIVVNDSRGFFTSRVIMGFVSEAIAAVGEGVEPATVEQAALQAGYPAGPLVLADDISLSLAQELRQQTEKALRAEGKPVPRHAATAVVDRLVELCRPGRAGSGGFYDYDDSGKRLRIWPGLRAEYNSGSTDIPLKDLQERMLFAEALETVKCLDEGVLNSIADANIGSILGIGFPAWTGGVVQYMNQYDGGLQGFVERARDLADRYGGRFTPPTSLVDKAARGEVFE
jgi:3-hydroxyacyl-CoA dehydrogenase/enoyl-CoA hydratase/3-hydroxybutyryl-CoA epimerase